MYRCTSVATDVGINVQVLEGENKCAGVQMYKGENKCTWVRR
jgi:hypothetical protein